MKYLFPAALLLSLSAAAQTTNVYTLQELNRYDVHQVKKGETVYGLSKHYGVKVADFLDLNPNVVNNNLKIGSTVKVPKAATTAGPGDAMPYQGIGPKPYLVPVHYKVAKGETLYSIGKKTQNEVEVLMLWNDLKAFNIRPDQQLIVGYAESTKTIIGTPRVSEKTSTATSVSKSTAKAASTAVTTVKEKPSHSVPSGTASENVAAKPVDSKTVIAEKTVERVPSNETVPTALASAAPGGVASSEKSSKSVYDSNSNAKLVYKNERGICTWTKGNADNGNFFALHPTAPIGSTVSVKNMMNNRSVQVKVIGRLPDTQENENVSIKISGSAAKQMDALDNKFLVQLSYMGYDAKPSKS